MRGILTGDEKVESGKAKQIKEIGEEEVEQFFTEGSEELRAMRLEIAVSSTKRAKERLAAERLHLSRTDEVKWEEESEQYMEWVQNTMSTDLSQVGDDRPLRT